MRMVIGRVIWAIYQFVRGFGSKTLLTPPAPRRWKHKILRSLVALVLGAAIGWLIARSRFRTTMPSWIPTRSRAPRQQTALRKSPNRCCVGFDARRRYEVRYWRTGASTDGGVRLGSARQPYPASAHTDAAHPVSLLRSRCEWPRNHTARNVMNSRHFIRSPRRRAIGLSWAPRCREPWPFAG